MMLIVTKPKLVWVGRWGWVWKQIYVENRRVSFIYFIVDKSIFYCPRDLWFGAHIDTGVIGFLNDSGCIYEEFELHCSLSSERRTGK